MTKECEGWLAALTGQRGAVVASRATVGLAATLRALGVGHGSGVLMPVLMCANVVHAVRGAGLEPVFVDMDERVRSVGFGMSLAEAERVVVERGDVRVLLAVPLFGGGLDAVGLMGLAERHNLMVVEDLAQCGVQNAERGIKAVASVYSFGAGKVGDAGGGAAVVSDDMVLLEKVRVELGGKRDLGEVAGRVMVALDSMEDEIAGRLGMALSYRDGLGEVVGVVHPGGGLPVWKYSVLMRDRLERDRITQRLLSRGVSAGNLYAPLSRWFGLHGDGGRGEFPMAWDIWERIVNLPLWPLRDGLLEDVVWALGGDRE